MATLGQTNLDDGRGDIEKVKRISSMFEMPLKVGLKLMPEEGLEPSPPCGDGILNPQQVKYNHLQTKDLQKVEKSLSTHLDNFCHETNKIPPEHIVLTPEKERAIKEIIKLLIEKASPGYCIEIAKIIREAYNPPTDK